ncbi:hypothetical protein [Rhizobium wuzhouense]|uniref:hypothetical protein n=1 Tax=Rhizobium wuzhouense TaxID=1986026 RepID=UPI000DA15604|nr:hypothetical protein [Rhizobium wuzhouense]
MRQKDDGVPRVRTQNFRPKKSVMECIFFAICIAGDANFHVKAKSAHPARGIHAKDTENAGLCTPRPLKLLLAN